MKFIIKNPYRTPTDTLLFIVVMILIAVAVVVAAVAAISVAALFIWLDKKIDKKSTRSETIHKNIT